MLGKPQRTKQKNPCIHGIYILDEKVNKQDNYRLELIMMTETTG